MPVTGRVGLVLAGGGARGAYEAGVLSYLFEDLPKHLGRPVHFDIVTGTSVGAVHACFVAASQQAASDGTALLDLWRSLSLDRVFAVGATDLVRVPWQLLGLGSVGALLPATDRGVPERRPGLFDTGWLEELVLDGDPAELNAAAALADHAVAKEAQTEVGYPHALFARGLAAYRLGRFDDAITIMNGKAASVAGPCPKLVIAMSLYQKGETDKARDLLAKAGYSWDRQGNLLFPKG